MFMCICIHVYMYSINAVIHVTSLHNQLMKHKTYIYRICLAKSNTYAGPSAGAEVARLRKWHVWCPLATLES